MATVVIIIISVIGFFSSGYITRYVQEYRLKRREKQALEEHYQRIIVQEKDRIIKEYESKIKELADLSPASRVDWLAKHTK